MAHSVRLWHRALGLALAIPCLLWAVTGAVFFVKPGYEEAYAIPRIRTYPLVRGVAVPEGGQWRSVRLVRTVIGDHVLVETVEGSRLQLDPDTLLPLEPPPPDAVTRLVTDALENRNDRSRYGEIASVTGAEVVTTTGVRLQLDWASLTLSQRGLDTDWIDRIYRLHYVQWTGVAWLDRVLGALALSTLVALALLGLVLWRRGRRAAS